MKRSRKILLLITGSVLLSSCEQAPDHSTKNAEWGTMMKNKRLMEVRMESVGVGLEDTEVEEDNLGT